MNELEIVRHPQISGLHIFFNAMEYRTPHFHSEWELTCPLENPLILSVEAQQHILQPGEMILLCPRQLHEYKSMGDPCTFICLQISDSLFPPLHGMCADDLFPRNTLSGSEYKEVIGLLLRIARAYVQQEPQYELYCIGQTALLFHLLLTRMPSHRMSRQRTSSRNLPPFPV